MANRFLVDSLITEIRSLISERNTNGALSDSLDIIPLMNIAQDRASTILAKYYQEPLLTNETITLQSGVTSYTIPENAFQDALVKVECKISNGIYREMPRIKARDSTAYETPASASIPLVYFIIGRTYNILPKPTGAYGLRIWYLEDLPKLDIQQGRIIQVDEANNTVYIDALVTDSDGANYLTTSASSDNAYVSIIDGQTGKRKGIFQISSMPTTDGATNAAIVFKSTTPTRTTIDNYTVSTSMTGLSVAKDDYLCLAPATCISVLRKPALNFITSYAATALQDGVLNGPNVGKLEDMAKEFEDDIKTWWSTQEQCLKVKAKSATWGNRARSRWPFPLTRGS